MTKLIFHCQKYHKNIEIMVFFKTVFKMLFLQFISFYIQILEFITLLLMDYSNQNVKICIYIYFIHYWKHIKVKWWILVHYSLEFIFEKFIIFRIFRLTPKKIWRSIISFIWMSYLFTSVIIRFSYLKSGEVDWKIYFIELKRFFLTIFSSFLYC